MTIKEISKKICDLLKEENVQGVILLTRYSEITVDFSAPAYKIGFLLGTATAAAQNDCKDIDDEGLKDFQRGIYTGFKKAKEHFDERN